MIIRILGEGQLAVEDSLATELNDRLEAAVNSGDENAFRPVLTQMLDRVRAVGTPVPTDSLESSDVILPYSDATMEDVRGLLSEDGLIPGR
jgi:hypothetical protein